MVAGLGLEPRQTDSESVVLPLHHPAMDLVYQEDNKRLINSHWHQDIKERYVALNHTGAQIVRQLYEYLIVAEIP